ncbi:MAG: hypothetical protein N2115_07705 [bacterium]|nr:hypothetical protein [bacterium]
MKKYAIFFYAISVFFVNNSSAGQITAKVEIIEKNLKQFQPIAVAELPFPEYGYVYVTDRNGLKVQSMRLVPDEKYQRNRIYFRTNNEDIYFVHWLSEERKTETAIFEIPEGKVILDDYLNPSARTSGFWFWVSRPVLNGRFSHTGRSQLNINSHYTAMVPVQKATGKDVIYQYVFLDRNNPPQEIMMEVQVQRRRSFYFSWGTDVIKWKALDKIRMGELPDKGKWAVLIIPVEKMGKDVEISGIGFYNAGGKVFWDYTTIGNPALQTKVIEWRKKDKKISAFFEKEIFGPFTFASNEFYVGTFDASASTGVDTYIWNYDNTVSTGKSINAIFDGKSQSRVSLLCLSRSKESDVFSETIIFQKSVPEEIRLFLKILPHRNIVYAGEEFFIPVQVGSLMSTIVPVEFSDGNGKVFLKLLPGRENAFDRNLFFSIAEPGVRIIEIKIGTFTIAQKKLKFLPVDDVDEKNIEGPYLVDSSGARIVAFIPDYRFSENIPAIVITKLLLIGDIPPGFFEMLKHQYFRDIEVVWFKYPESSRSYHAIMNTLWVKKQIENQNFDAVILFPPLDALLRRTPVDEYVSTLDTCIWFLSRHAKRIICATPFPSAPLPEIFFPYANSTKNLCKKRNVVCLDLYNVYTKIEGWTELFSVGRGVYRNFPSQQGYEILAESIVKILKDL